MNWEEIVEKQIKEYKEHLNGHHDSRNKLNEEKANLLQHMKCSKETELPEPMQKLLTSNREAWENEWGMYGSRFKAMRIAQQKEIDKYFRHREMLQAMDNRSKDKNKDKGAEL